jgi:hypothetical protein
VRQRFLPEAGPRRTVAETIGDVAWIPATSPVTPYLALLARRVLATRDELDEVVYQRSEAVIVPGPRGSSWLVPAAEAPLARAFAVADHASREARIAAGATLTSRELEGARDALRAALASPATAAEIRERIPERFLRSLGEPGRKCGVTTVAALVLRHMWVTGEVVRIAGDTRGDGTAVKWGLDPRPRTVPTAADAVVVIAPRWLAAYGPVSVKAFATAFGIAAGRASAALRSARALEAEIEGLEGTYMVPPDFQPPAPAPQPPRLLPLRDPLTDVHLGLLATPAAARLALTRGHGVGPTVLLDGEVVGTWQYDEIAKVIAWRTAGAPLAPEVAARVDEEARRTALFIAGQLVAAPLHTPQTARPRPLPPAVQDLSIEV